MQSIGIFSGTFNPVHDGHVAFALQALDTCHLDRVVFLPEQSPRYKENLPDAAVRAAQLRQKIMKYPHLDVLVLDQAQFTVLETLPELHRHFKDATFTLLLGSDVARGLADWPNIADLATNVSFAIGLRKQDTPDILQGMERRIEDLLGMKMRTTYITTPHAYVSSSQFRK